MMEYITAKPRTLTATETRLLRSIESAGWWSVDARCLSYDDQEALEFLWRSGYIERKAYGGWGVKGSVKPAPTDAEAIRALLASAGVDVDRIRTILPTTGAWLRPGKGRQYTVVFNSTVRLNGAKLDTFASDVIVDGSFLVLRIKE